MADIDDLNTETIEIPEEKPVVVELDEPNVEKKAHNEPDEREIALKEMRAQYEEQKKRAEMERHARQQAEQYAYQQAQKANYAQAEVQDSNLRTILNAISADEQAAANAERVYADAIAAGDTALAAKAQREMAKAEARLVQLENGRRALEERLQATEGRVEEPEMPRFAPQPTDPVDALASRLTPKSAAWLRQHPEAANSVNKLTAAHQAAVELEGIQPESPEYFAYIEQKLGYSETPRQASRKSNISSAPVSSAGSMMSSRQSGSSSTMVLSPAEVEQALLNEPDLPREKALEFYAKNKAALIREGKLHT